MVILENQNLFYVASQKLANFAQTNHEIPQKWSGLLCQHLTLSSATSIS